MSAIGIAEEYVKEKGKKNLIFIILRLTVSLNRKKVENMVWAQVLL